MKNQHITLTSIILALSCFAFLPKTQAVSPTAGRLLSRFHDGGRVQRASVTSPAGLEIQDLVGMRCLGLAPAVSTPALAPERWSSTMQIPIRQWAPRRLYSTPRAQGTAPLEQPPWSITTTAPTIPLWARSRCKPTPTEATTLRWATAALQNSTGDYNTAIGARRGAPIQISSATMSISAIPVLPAMRM